MSVYTQREGVGGGGGWGGGGRSLTERERFQGKDAEIDRAYPLKEQTLKE